MTFRLFRKQLRSVNTHSRRIRDSRYMYQYYIFKVVKPKYQDTRSLFRIFGPHMGHITTRHKMSGTKHNQGKNSK